MQLWPFQAHGRIVVVPHSAWGRSCCEWLEAPGWAIHWRSSKTCYWRVSQAVWAQQEKIHNSCCWSRLHWCWVGHWNAAFLSRSEVDHYRFPPSMPRTSARQCSTILLWVHDCLRHQGVLQLQVWPKEFRLLESHRAPKCCRWNLCLHWS